MLGLLDRKMGLGGCCTADSGMGCKEARNKNTTWPGCDGDDLMANRGSTLPCGPLEEEHVLARRQQNCCTNIDNELHVVKVNFTKDELFLRRKT